MTPSSDSTEWGNATSLSRVRGTQGVLLPFHLQGLCSTPTQPHVPLTEDKQTAKGSFRPSHACAARH